MYQVFIFFLIFKFTVTEDSNKKYIDLLPEEEKRQFLDKIARRILEDFQNNKVPIAPQTEMSDVDLDTHSAYVQSLLKEETNNLRIERNYNETKDIESNQDQKFIERRQNKNAKSEHVDLTLRSGKRSKRLGVTKTTKENTDYDESPVKSFSDVSNETSITVNNYYNVSSELNITTVPTYISPMPKNDYKLNTTSEDTDNRDEIKGAFFYDDEVVNSTVMNDFEPHSTQTIEYKNSVESLDKSLDSNITYISVDQGNSNLSSAKDIISTTQGYLISRNGGNIETAIENKKFNSNVEINKDIIKDNISTDKAFSEAISTIKLSQTDKTLYESYLENKHGDDIDKNESLNATIINKKNEETNTTLVDAKSSSQTESTSIRKDSIKFISTESVADFGPVIAGSTVEKQIPITTKTILRNGVTTSLPEKITTNDNKRNPEKANLTIETKRYEVYEIHSEEPSFEPKIKTEENPRYIPVYNYDPESAYYDPYNRLGPNVDDKHGITRNRNTLNNANIQIDISERRNRFKNPYNNAYKLQTLYYKIPKNTKYYNLLKPEPIHITNSFNPDDYYEADYNDWNTDADIREEKQYILKNRDKEGIRHNPFTFVIEDDRPTKLATLKPVLVERLQQPNRKVINQNEDDRKFQLENGISLDYYFGRSNHNKHSKSILMNFILPKNEESFNPITPIPKYDIGISKKRHKVKEVQEKTANNDITSFVNVMLDMIKDNSEALNNYDWLGTAVDVRSALEKLKDLTIQLKNNQRIDLNDLELYKYVLFLYKSSLKARGKGIGKGFEKFKKTLQEFRKNSQSRWVPHIKKKQNRSAMKMWKDVATFLRDMSKVQDRKLEILRQFESFLAEIEMQLLELHNAIKHIALVTSYNNQRWYSDLRELFLNSATERQALQLILHLSLTRFLGLVEESSRNGVEENFMKYIKWNRREVNTAKEELLFVLILLNKLKEIDD